MNQNQKIATVIGRFDGTTKEEAVAYLRGLCFEYRNFEWRNAEVVQRLYHSASYAAGNANNFHQDCCSPDGSVGGPLFIVVWSNREPTEIKDCSSGLILPSFQPCDVVFISNRLYKHKTPAIISPDRLFFRCYPLNLTVLR